MRPSSHSADRPASARTVRLAIDPPLDERARRVLVELGGREALAGRIWRGQPRRRCPWSPSADGRALVVDPRAADAVAWLRFLVREVLAPTSGAARTRAAACGLAPPYGVSGRVELTGPVGPVRVSVGDGRVRVVGAGGSVGHGGPAS